MDAPNAGDAPAIAATSRTSPTTHVAGRDPTHRAGSLPWTGERAGAASGVAVPGRRRRGLVSPLVDVGVPVLVLAVAFAIPLLIVPPTLPQPLIDDWNYGLSVRHLVENGELWIAPWTAATLIAQIVWGALFAWTFGFGSVALRASTLVAAFGGVLACHALFREVGATRARALLGALAVWLNPLVLGLSYTFMTDVPYLALLSVSTWATVRATRRASLGWLVIGSAVAGVAFLVRQQGLLLPFAAVGWLLLFGPDRFRSSPWRTALAALGPCAIAVAGYYRWRATSGLPATQEDYVQSLRDAGPWGTVDLVWRLGVVCLFFLGLFVLPLVVGGLRDVPAAWRRAGPAARHLIVVGLACLAIWTRWYAGQHGGNTFPFVPWGSMLHEDGLGVLDADGVRPALLPTWVFATMAAVCACSVATAIVLVAGRDRSASILPPVRGAAPIGGLLLVLALGQFAGAVPPSLHIRQFVTFDRYYLPLLPFALALLFWGIRGRRFSAAPVWVVLTMFLAVGVLGVQDWLAFKREQWQTAEWLTNEQGVPLRQIDAAVQWDGVHFYEYGLAHPEDRVERRPGDIWWLYLVAPMIDPVYIVAASPVPRAGYDVVATRPYESWIRSDDEAQVYVWRREPERPVFEGSLRTPRPSATSSLPERVRGAGPNSERNVAPNAEAEEEPTVESGGPR